MRHVGIQERLPVAVVALATVSVVYAAIASAVHAQAVTRATERSWSLSPSSAPPVTVRDLIRMATFGGGNGYERDDHNLISPDGARVAVVVNRGDLERSTIDCSLVVLRTADLLRSPKPDTVATMASTSNRPCIAHARWLSDNATLIFLGERPGELPQVYAVDTRTHAVTQRTRATTVITAFEAAGAANVVVYAAEEQPDTSAYASMRARGFVLAAGVDVSDVIAGDWGRAPPWEAKVPRTLHVVRGGTETTLALPDSAAGYNACDLRYLSVAPSGDLALVPCTPRVTPATWAAYRQEEFRRFTAMGRVFPMYAVVDLATGHAHPLTDAPVAWRTNFVWASNGASVVLANAIMPLDVADATERTARATHVMLAEVNTQTGAVTVIARRDSLVALAWDARRAAVELAPGRYESGTETRRVYYQKTRNGWIPGQAGRTATVPALVLDQGMNTPPRLVAIDPRARVHHVVYDPNPSLLLAHWFAREEAVHWKTKAGAAWVGGLYRPPDYVPGRRYPLVIQTHGFDSTYFRPDGIFPTGEAAQPLANRGVMVLQMDMPPERDGATPREGPLAVQGAESAIDYLDSLGLIDRRKVGMQGFSRTSYHTLYFLTHSSYPIAAATVTDGVDASYVQHLVFGTVAGHASYLGEEYNIYGGPPLGASLARWIEQAPGFNLDHVTAPLHLTAVGRGALLEEWEPYAGLLLQGKPAEMVYIPEGSHILVKPWERLTSQQGAVDWYLFWLKGEEDPDPAKSEQYARWHVLRAMRDSSTAKTAAAQGR